MKRSGNQSKETTIVPPSTGIPSKASKAPVTHFNNFTVSFKVFPPKNIK